MAKTKRAAAKGTQKAPVPKKAVAKNDPVQEKMKKLEKRIRLLEAAFAEGTEETETVDYEIKFFGGAGEIQFKGENLQRTEDHDTGFHVNQTKGKQRVQAGGTAPEGTNGRIEVQVKQNGAIISPFSENVFKKGVFISQIIYIIK